MGSVKKTLNISSTTGKRVKVPMRASNYHIGKLKGQNPISAQVCKHEDGNFYIHIQHCLVQ